MRKNLSGLLALTLSFSLSGAASAAVKLPAVDCAKSADLRCKPASASRSGDIGGGDFGLGFGGFSDNVGSGFVDVQANAAYLPLETLAQMDNFGGVIKVDLATGDRTLVSGRLDDQMPMRGKGVSYVSDRGQAATGWGLGRVMVVRPGIKPGTVLAMQHYGSETRTVILEINLATGDRTIVWANRFADDAASSRLDTSIQNIEAKLGITEATLCNRMGPSPVSFEVYQGSLILFAKTSVFKVKPGVSCELVSGYDADGNSQAGSGATPITSVKAGSWLDGSVASVTSGPGRTFILGIDLNTGERKLISLFDGHNVNRGVGKGEFNIGYLGTHVSTRDYYVTTGYTSVKDFYYTRVEKATGNRLVMEGKGSLSRGSSMDPSIVATIPGTNTVLAYWEDALHVLDVTTGMAYILSR